MTNPTSPSSAKFSRLAAMTCLGLLMAPGCREPTPTGAVPTDWLTCVECTEGELDSLKALAGRQPETVEVLRDALILGPSPATRQRLTSHLEEAYRQVAGNAMVAPPGAPPGLPETAFVTTYLGNMVSIYRGRAARALAEIGGSAGRDALEAALDLPLDSLGPAVRAQVRYARDSILGP